MRWPSGDRTASPTARKRDRSLLAKPCALVAGVRSRSAAKLKRLKPTRSQTDCLHECMKFSLKSFHRQICPAIVGPPACCGQRVLLGSSHELIVCGGSSIAFAPVWKHSVFTKQF